MTPPANAAASPAEPAAGGNRAPDAVPSPPPSSVAPPQPSEGRPAPAAAPAAAPAGGSERPVSGASPAAAPGSPAGSEAALAAPEPPPEVIDPAEDLRLTEASNWFADLRLQMHRGRHPDPKTDARLRRVFGFSPGQFNGPYLIRLLVSWALILTVCALAWVVLSNVASALGWTGFVYDLSIWMSLIMIALFGLAISQPSSLLDEKALEEAARTKLEKGTHPFRTK
jgi:hypothetical protein